GLLSVQRGLPFGRGRGAAGAGEGQRARWRLRAVPRRRDLSGETAPSAAAARPGAAGGGVRGRGGPAPCQVRAGPRPPRPGGGARCGRAPAARAGGGTTGATARRGGSGRRTAERYRRQAPPARKRRSDYGQRRVITPDEPYLLRRWEEGCRTATVLWREIRAQGFAPSLTNVQRFVAELRRQGPAPIGSPSSRPQLLGHGARRGLPRGCAAVQRGRDAPRGARGGLPPRQVPCRSCAPLQCAFGGGTSRAGLASKKPTGLRANPQ